MSDATDSTRASEANAGVRRNRDEIARLLDGAYPILDTADVRRLLDEAARVARGDGTLLQVTRNATRLTIKRYDKPGNC